MKTVNNHSDQSRIINLDFLRGVVIILAIQQHFVYYFNVWFVSYFKDFSALSSTYEILLPLMNKSLASDVYNHFMAVVFTPWVSQIYLCLAAFNLAKRNQHDFQGEYSKKIRIFILIFVAFIFENFLVAPNTGEAISIYPIMLWMVVLSILATAYNFLGIKGVLALGVLSLVRFVIPIDMLSDFFQEVVRSFIHPGFEYDARLEYFFLSGVLGFVIGYIYNHKKRSFFLKFMQIMMVLSGVYAIFFYFLGEDFIVYIDNFLMTEHVYAQSFSGTFYILSIMTLVVGLSLLLEIKKKIIFIRPINWVGENSILVFFVHRIFITKIFIPLYLLIGCLGGWIPQNNIVEAYSAVMAVGAFCYFIKKSSITELIVKK